MNKQPLLNETSHKYSEFIEKIDKFWDFFYSLGKKSTFSGQESVVLIFIVSISNLFDRKTTITHKEIFEEEEKTNLVNEIYSFCILKSLKDKVIPVELVSYDTGYIALSLAHCFNLEQLPSELTEKIYNYFWSLYKKDDKDILNLFEIIQHTQEIEKNQKILKNFDKNLH